MEKSNLDYTILQPSRLVESPTAGKFQLGVKQLEENSIDDVACMLSELINYSNTIKQVFTRSDGNIEISDALAIV